MPPPLNLEEELKKKRKLSLLDKRDEEQSDGGSWKNTTKYFRLPGMNATSSKFRGGIKKQKTLPLG